MLFDSLVLISLLIVILMLRQAVGVMPSLAACLLRWKENLNLESSVKLSRDRNFLATAMIIPFCCTAFRYGLYAPRFMEQMTENGRLGLTIGIFFVYLLLRMATSALFRPQKIDRGLYKAAEHSAFSFFIILTLALLAIGGILSFIGIDTSVCKSAMIWVSALIYLLFLIRKTQIFASSCSIFTAFLYLCALEIIPTGMLVVSAVIF